MVADNESGKSVQSEVRTSSGMFLEKKQVSRWHSNRFHFLSFVIFWIQMVRMYGKEYHVDSLLVYEVIEDNACTFMVVSTPVEIS